MKVKSLVFSTLAVILIATALVGCGNSGGGQTSGGDTSAPSADPAQQAESNDSAAPASEAPAPADGERYITWLSLFDTEEPVKAILEKFQAETGIEVRQSLCSFDELFEIIETEVKSGTSKYDVISVDVPMVAAYATRGYILPLDEYFSADEKAKYVPSALNAGSWQGTFYAAPETSSSMMLWYNKDLLEEAGITLRESSFDNRLTYEELEQYATDAMKKLDPDGSKGLLGIGLQQVSRTYQMCMFANSMGEKNIGDDGFTVDGVINNEGWVKAMTWYQQLYDKGLALKGYDAEQITPSFNSGKVIFMIGAPWTQARLTDVNYGFVPSPAFKGFEDKVGTPTGGWHLGINKGTEKVDMSVEFIKYMTIGEGNDLWLVANSETPATLSAIKKIVDDPNGDPLQKIACYEAEHTGVPRALTPGYSEYQTIMNATFEDIRNGADVKGALDNAVKQIDSAFQKYK